MLSVIDTAYYVVSSYSNFHITPLKLQKLLYYLKVWGLVADHEVFKADFVKWKYGPVNSQVYHEFNGFKKSEITVSNKKYKAPDTKDKEFIDFVIESYGSFPAETLSALTHKEDPWLKAKSEHVIEDEEIKKYYSKSAFAKNFPIEIEKKPYYAVTTDFYYSFILDFLTDNPQKPPIPVYPSFVAFKNQRMKAQSEINNFIQHYFQFK